MCSSSALVHFVAGERSKAAAQGHRLVHRSNHSIDSRLALGGEGFGRVWRHQRYRPPAFGDDHLLAGFYRRENLGKALIGLARGDASHCMLQVVRVVHLSRGVVVNLESRGLFTSWPLSTRALIPRQIN